MSFCGPFDQTFSMQMAPEFHNGIAYKKSCTVPHGFPLIGGDFILPQHHSYIPAAQKSPVAHLLWGKPSRMSISLCMGKNLLRADLPFRDPILLPAAPGSPLASCPNHFIILFYRLIFYRRSSPIYRNLIFLSSKNLQIFPPNLTPDFLFRIILQSLYHVL